MLTIRILFSMLSKCWYIVAMCLGFLILPNRVVEHLDLFFFPCGHDYVSVTFCDPWAASSNRRYALTQILPSGALLLVGLSVLVWKMRDKINNTAHLFIKKFIAIDIKIAALLKKLGL